MAETRYQKLRSSPITAERVHSLLAFYHVVVYDPESVELNGYLSSLSSISSGKGTFAGPRKLDLEHQNGIDDAREYLEYCLEELAIVWGLDWFRIRGLGDPLGMERQEMPFSA